MIGGEQQHIGGEAPFGAKPADALDGRARQLAVDAGAGMLAGRRVGGRIGGKGQGRLFAAQDVGPVGEQPLARRAVEAPAQPVGGVGMLDHRRRRGLLGVPIEPAPVSGQDLQRFLVHDHVVERQQQPCPVGCRPQQQGAQQRRRRSVDRLHGEGAGHRRLDRRIHLPGRNALLLQRDGDAVEQIDHHLAGILAGDAAQDLMPLSQGIEAAGDPRGVDPSGQIQQQVDVVADILRVQRLQQPQPPLGRGGGDAGPTVQPRNHPGRHPIGRRRPVAIPVQKGQQIALARGQLPPQFFGQRSGGSVHHQPSVASRQTDALAIEGREKLFEAHSSNRS
ncbi:hypothetical protein EI613_31145 [Azospirillum sp. 412522]|nr:hypothetical protein [Azospirillum sp. 412522]